MLSRYYVIKNTYIHFSPLAPPLPRPLPYYPPLIPCHFSGRCTIDPSTNNSSSNLTCYNLCELHNMTQCFCPGDDDCKTCCKSRDINASCRLLMIGGRERNLPDRTSCVGGLCMAGVCEPNTPDLVNRLYRLFADISIDEFGELTTFTHPLLTTTTLHHITLHIFMQFCSCVRTLCTVYCSWPFWCGFLEVYSFTFV